MTQTLIIPFIIYPLAMVAIGIGAYFATRNFDDYLLGSRKIGSFITAMATGASDMSAWLLMGLPGAVYCSGLPEIWLPIGLYTGAYANWRLIAPRLRRFTQAFGDALTLPDYLHQRFGAPSHLLSCVTTLVILVFFTVYCASGMVAGARLFESAFGLHYPTGLWIAATITVVYTFLGGFFAISLTDTIQASLMVFALIFTPVIAVASLNGWSDTLASITHAQPSALNPFHQVSVISMLSLLSWGIGYMGQPHILVRFMAAERVSTLKPARWIAMTWTLLCLTGAVVIGLVGIAYFNQSNQHIGQIILNHDNERVFMVLIGALFHSWVGGLLLSAILAAMMSTLSCQLLIGAGALTNDLYRAYCHPHASQKELMWVGRLMVLLVAVISFWISHNPHRRVLSLVSYAWSGLGASFGPVILISLFWQRMTNNGAIIGMIVGGLSVAIWGHFRFFGLYEMLPGFSFACLAIIIVSLLDNPPPLSVKQQLETLAAADS